MYLSTNKNAIAHYFSSFEIADLVISYFIRKNSKYENTVIRVFTKNKMSNRFLFKYRWHIFFYRKTSSLVLIRNL